VIETANLSISTSTIKEYLDKYFEFINKSYSFLNVYDDDTEETHENFNAMWVRERPSDIKAIGFREWDRLLMYDIDIYHADKEVVRDVIKALQTYPKSYNDYYNASDTSGTYDFEDGDHSFVFANGMARDTPYARSGSYGIGCTNWGSLGSAYVVTPSVSAFFDLTAWFKIDTASPSDHFRMQLYVNATNKIQIISQETVDGTWYVEVVVDGVNTSGYITPSPSPSDGEWHEFKLDLLANKIYIDDQAYTPTVVDLSTFFTTTARQYRPWFYNGAYGSVAVSYDDITWNAGFENVIDTLDKWFTITPTPLGIDGYDQYHWRVTIVTKDWGEVT